MSRMAASNPIIPFQQIDSSPANSLTDHVAHVGRTCGLALQHARNQNVHPRHAMYAEGSR